MEQQAAGRVLGYGAGGSEVRRLRQQLLEAACRRWGARTIEMALATQSREVWEFLAAFHALEQRAAGDEGAGNIILGRGGGNPWHHCGLLSRAQSTLFNVTRVLVLLAEDPELVIDAVEEKCALRDGRPG